MESEKSPGKKSKKAKAVEVPADWSKMTDKQKDAWVEAALTEIGSD